MGSSAAEPGINNAIEAGANIRIITVTILVLLEGVAALSISFVFDGALGLAVMANVPAASLGVRFGINVATLAQSFLLARAFFVFLHPFK